MKKNVVKINENTLRQIVAESVKKVLKEGYRGPNETEYLASDILSFIVQAEKKYTKANTYEAAQIVLDSLTPKTTYGYEDDPDQGHTFGY